VSRPRPRPSRPAPPGPASGAAEPGGSGDRLSFGPAFLTDLFRSPLDPGYADAAARRARLGPRTGWRRSVARTGSVLTLAAMGFLLAVAYTRTMAEEPERSRARAGLVTQVHDRQAVTDALQTRADQLREEVARRRDAALTDTDAARLRALEAGTGLGRVRGDGVVVQVDDAPPSVDAVTGKGPDDYGRVIDRDLQDIANALWAAGAEAVAINGQRLTATSTIRTAGQAILVDHRPVAPPYRVAAIGPESLERAFAASEAARLMRGLAKEYGLGYQLRRAAGLTLPAAAEPKLRYARPAVEPTPGASPSGRSPAGPTPGGGPAPTAGGPSRDAPSPGPATTPSGGG